MNYEDVIVNIRKELKDYIQKNNIKSLVIGISGGMDSCLCAALARPVCDELDIPLIGRSLPMSTNKQDELDRAKLTGRVFCTDFEEVNLETLFKYSWPILNVDTEPDYEIVNGHLDKTSASIKNEFSEKIRKGNLKARLRMIYLYNLASLNHGMVLSTDNYTEYLLGFWTLHGDVGDYGMIQNLWKSEVYDIATWMVDNELDFIDQQIAMSLTIDALATDGLGVTNMGDLGQILPEWTGSSRDGYKEVDRILQIWQSLDKLNDLQKAAVGPIADSPVVKRHLASEFKRQNPYNIPRYKIVTSEYSKIKSQL